MEANTGEIKKKKLAFPKPFAVMMILCLIFSLLSYVIPSSSYQMMEIEYEAADGSIATRSVVDPDTWALAEEDHSVSFMEYLTSFIRGMEAVPDIMFCIFISTAAFYIVNETGAIVAGVGRLIIKLGNKKFIIVPILGTVFTLLGATVGTYEELLCFIPILAPILIGAGYDSLLTVAVVMCSGAAGFAGAAALRAVSAAAGSQSESHCKDKYETNQSFFHMSPPSPHNMRFSLITSCSR